MFSFFFSSLFFADMQRGCSLEDSCSTKDIYSLQPSCHCLFLVLYVFFVVFPFLVVFVEGTVAVLVPSAMLARLLVSCFELFSECWSTVNSLFSHLVLVSLLGHRTCFLLRFAEKFILANTHSCQSPIREPLALYYPCKSLLKLNL